MATNRRPRSLAVRDADHLKTLIRRSIDRITELGISQAQLERTIGLSQGYLARVRARCGRPSPTLVALLAMLAAHPPLVIEIAQFWADNPSPRHQAPPESTDTVRSNGDPNDR